MTAPPSTAAEVQAWVAKARSGARLLYHVGNMSMERAQARVRGRPLPLGAVFAELMDQQKRGYVLLVQRKRRQVAGADPVYEYWAERRFKAPDHERSVVRR